MKKIKIIYPILVLLLTSCANNEKELSIITPTGAPALAFYNYFTNENFQTNSTPINIASQMNKNGCDIVVIDTIKGVQTINEGAPYKLAANITFGNFYLVSTGNDDNNVLDENDEIVIFGQKQTPDKLFNLLFEGNYSINYVSSAAEASKCIISGKTLDLSKEVDYVLAAQPSITGALKNNNNASIYANIQELYKQKTNKDLIQAGLFVKDGVDANSFLKDLESDINDLLNDSDLLIEATSSINEQLLSNMLGGLNVTLASTTIKNNNSIGLGFKYACENKDNIDQFLSLFNMEIADEKIYQK